MVNGIIGRELNDIRTRDRRPNRSAAWGAVWAAAVLGIVSTGCAAAVPAESDWEELEAAPGQGGDLPDDAGRSPMTPAEAGVVGHAANGALVLFSAASGEILASTHIGPDARSEPPGHGVDLAFDAVRGAVVRVSSPLLGRAADVVSYALLQQEDGSFDFGPPWRWGWAAHGSAAWPLEAGLLLFEPAPTPRWRMVDDDGITRAELTAPMPRSAWVSGALSTPVMHALVQLPVSEPLDGRGLGLVAAATQEDDSPAFVTTAVAPGAWPLSPEARMCAWPSGSVGDRTDRPTLLVDVQGGAVRLRWGVGVHVGPPTELPLTAPVERIVDVAVMPGPEPTHGPAPAHHVLLLVTGPERLIAVRVQQDLGVETVEQLELNGELPLTALSGRYLLPVTERRLLVATRRDIRAFELASTEAESTEPATPSWRRAPDFDGSHLRGPVAGPLPLNP